MHDKTITTPHYMQAHWLLPATTQCHRNALQHVKSKLTLTCHDEEPCHKGRRSLTWHHGKVENADISEHKLWEVRSISMRQAQRAEHWSVAICMGGTTTTIARTKPLTTQPTMQPPDNQ